MSRRVLLAALLVLAVRLLLAILVIPPWQQPDEQAHVAATEAWRSRHEGSHVTDVLREREILQSMLSHRWWQHYGFAPPATAPRRFDAVDALLARSIAVSPLRGGFPEIGRAHV